MNAGVAFQFLDGIKTDTIEALTPGGSVVISSTLVASHIHGNIAGNVYSHARASRHLSRDPVYVSGYHGSGSSLIPTIAKADASNSAKMPAVGIMDANASNQANCHFVITGAITELNTNSYAANAELYVANGGGLTATQPSSNCQPVARVERSNTNNGAILVGIAGVSTSGGNGSSDAGKLARFDSSGKIPYSNISGFENTAKTTPVDNDRVAIFDSAASNTPKYSLWSSIKATLKTYFDTVYAAVSHTHASADITDASAITEGNGSKVLKSRTDGTLGSISVTGSGQPYIQVGVTDKVGVAALVSYGNRLDGTSIAELYLQRSDTAEASIRVDNLTGIREIQMPNASGTLALTTDMTDSVSGGGNSDSGKLVEYGNLGVIYTTGPSSSIFTTGQDASIYTIGANATIYTEGESAIIGTSGANAEIFTSGDEAHITTFGANAYIQTGSTFKISNGVYTTTLSGTQTTNRSIAFPNASGTVALTSDSRFTDSRTPTAHVHGNITSDGKIGTTTTSNQVVITTTGGALTTASRDSIDTRSSFPNSSVTAASSGGNGASDANKLAKFNSSGFLSATNISGLATVATTGTYSSLTGKPSLGTIASKGIDEFVDVTSDQVVQGNKTFYGVISTLGLDSVIRSGTTFELVTSGSVKTTIAHAPSVNRTVTLPNRTGTLAIAPLGPYAGDTAAAAGGVPIGGLYYIADGSVKIRLT